MARTRTRRQAVVGLEIGEADRRWLRAEASRRGMKLYAVVAEAIRLYREARELHATYSKGE